MPEQAQAAALVGGEPFAGLAAPPSPSACRHDGDFRVQTKVARVLNDGGDGAARWDLRVRAFCDGCGAHFEFDHAAREPLEPPGVVLTMRPSTDRVAGRR